MKLLKIILPILLGVFMTQCDSSKRREAKAEDLIRKHLFETLDNYSTYENISIEVDTLREYHLSSPEVLNSAKDYLISVYKSEVHDERVADLKDRCGSAAVSFSISHGDAVYNAMQNYAYASQELEKAQKDQALLRTATATKKEYFDSIYNSVTVPENNYWHITHKFRYADNGSDTRIYTYHYIVDPEVKEIILSWDENDDDPYTFETIDYIRNYGND